MSVEPEPTSASLGCNQCHSNAKARRREFSEQAWSALLAWGEVTQATAGNPICGTCYSDLRDTLIDRADELASLASQPSSPAKKKHVKKGSRVA